MNKSLKGYMTAALLVFLLGSGLQAKAQDVLLVGAEDNVNTTGYIDDVQSKIEDTGLLTTVDTFDASIGTPTLGLLQTYDAVLVWSSASFQDSNAMGDVLADYVDGGGGVVQAGFSFTLGWPLGGRWRTEAYEVWQPADDEDHGDPLMLGTLYQPGHPILAGVTSFDGGASSFHMPVGDLNSGATTIADWSNYVPLIGENIATFNGCVVGLNFWPPSSDVRASLWDVNTDGDLLMANALLYCSEVDSDGDGVNDRDDLCPDTVPGDPVDATGCSISHVTYGFEGLSAGTLVGQDNWTLFGGGNSLQVGDGSGTNTTLVATNPGTFSGTNYMQRINNENFHFPSFSGLETAVSFEVDLQIDRSQWQVMILYLQGSNGTAKISPWFGVNTQQRFTFREATGAAQIDVPIPASIDTGDWVRLRLDMDFTANAGAGIGHVSFRNLTDGDTIFTPVAGLQNLNLLLSPNADPAAWDRMTLRYDGPHPTAVIDNLTVAIHEDSDGDSIIDDVDNCPDVANPSQSNIDVDLCENGDFDGDLCDICPADCDNNCNIDGSAAEEVSSATGGTVETPDGQLAIDIDPEDLGVDTTISVTQPVINNPEVDLSIGGDPGEGQAVAFYDIEPGGLEFNSSVTLNIMADVTDLTATQRTELDLYRLEDTNGDLIPDTFVPLGATCVLNEVPPGTFIATCTAQVNHFSTYAIVAPLDSDGDSVPDSFDGQTDVCPATIIPEGVPTRHLRKNRYALTGVPDNFTFESTHRTVITIADTGGCSCEQIIENLGLGGPHTLYGCTNSAIRTWISTLNP